MSPNGWHHSVTPTTPAYAYACFHVTCCMHRRDSELQLLTGLVDLVDDTFSGFAALQPAARGAAEIGQEVGREIVQEVGRDGSELGDGWLGHVDAAAAAAMEQVLLRQQELIGTWEACLEAVRGAEARGEYAEYAEHGEHGEGGWGLELQTRQAVAAQLNALLRRLWTSSQVLSSVSAIVVLSALTCIPHR